MESGKIDWKKVPIEIAEVIETSVQTTTPLWKPQDLKMVVDVDENIPTMYGDRDRVMQVLVNLISNAVKFTDSGSITCTARAHDDEIMVSVSDTGSGISPEDQKKIFERFKQAGDTLTGKPKGTGLGLPICKQIVDHHQGRIWVDSKLGEGSSFPLYSGHWCAGRRQPDSGPHYQNSSQGRPSRKRGQSIDHGCR